MTNLPLTCSFTNPKHQTQVCLVPETRTNSPSLPSVGHIIIDALTSRFAIHMSPSKALDGFTGHSHVTLGEFHIDLMLFKPKHFMNITRPAVATTLCHTAHIPGTIIVIHDSLQHTPKTLSVKFGGSANGHNGIQSIIGASEAIPTSTSSASESVVMVMQHHMCLAGSLLRNALIGMLVAAWTDLQGALQGSSQATGYLMQSGHWTKYLLAVCLNTV
ncbi:peptidyl-tRNA hydrolase-domain-containing protein [Boletus reticuloceps]|uniref:Peptidyl-tRNA hydrolase-domain-containing protein n=1 Tax=Boletus reticuloceps TaxID=495285 RepID=A0A8I3A8K1_9AGAM|nr:peptidyl-tRNA hydrolase-domain-containing protein [Boletus reticuloceps]